MSCSTRRRMSIRLVPRCRSELAKVTSSGWLECGFSTGAAKSTSSATSVPLRRIAKLDCAKSTYIAQGMLGTSASSNVSRYQP